MRLRPDYWTNPSVRALIEGTDRDPVEVMSEKVRSVVLNAIQEGWTGPPYDPFALADRLKIQVVPREDIADARTVPSATGLRIEFNPNRPKGRLRYSICHELAHSLFPDCQERIRHRMTHEKMKGDDWQLEMLCNIAAAELVMPIGSFSVLSEEQFSVDNILDLRKRFEVSAEAVLLRLIKLTDQQGTFFCASTVGSHRSEKKGRYVVDYAVGSRAWPDFRLRPGTQLPDNTVVSECTAIGYTAKGLEEWTGLGKVRVECLGVTPYPNHTFPRVVGLLRPVRHSPPPTHGIAYLKGNATEPRGSGKRLLAQVVNDSAFTWGGGFSLVVRKKWPAAQEAFRSWAFENRRNLSLGNVHVAPIDENLAVVSLVAQHGYGPSPRPRIRYLALNKCLQQLGQIAADLGAKVHMPRIGCGQAGGSWSIVGELIDESICRLGIDVFIYDLPGTKVMGHPQTAMQFPPSPSEQDVH